VATAMKMAAPKLDMRGRVDWITVAVLLSQRGRGRRLIQKGK
jgi:hypothetical protein